MKNMKKILALLVALVMVFSVASCGKKKEKEQKNNENNVKTEQNNQEKEQKTTEKNQEKDDKKPANNNKVVDKALRSDEEIPQNKVIKVEETSNTKENTKEIFKEHNKKPAEPANMHNLFKVLNIVDIADSALKVEVNGENLLYRIINNEKYFDVSYVAYAKVAAAIFAIHPEITNIKFVMEYLGNAYNTYYFDSPEDVSVYLGDSSYKAENLKKVGKDEDSLKKFLGKLDKIKVPKVDLAAKTEKCFAYNEWADYKYAQYEKKMKKYNFILSENAELPPMVENLYFENDEDIYEGFYGKPIELLHLNVKQVNIEKPVSYFFLFDGDQVIWFGNVDGYEDLSLSTIRYGLTEEILDMFKQRGEEKQK